MILVKLFATLRKNGVKEVSVNFKEGLSVKDIVSELQIPECELAIILVNGKHNNLDYIVKQNDTLFLFPPVGGG